MGAVGSRARQLSNRPPCTCRTCWRCRSRRCRGREGGAHTRLRGAALGCGTKHGRWAWAVAGGAQLEQGGSQMGSLRTLGSLRTASKTRCRWPLSVGRIAEPSVLPVPRGHSGAAATGTSEQRWSLGRGSSRLQPSELNPNMLAAPLSRFSFPRAVPNKGICQYNIAGQCQLGLWPPSPDPAYVGMASGMPEWGIPTS